VAAALVAVLAGGGLAAGPGAASADDAGLATLASTGQQVVDSYMSKSTPSDPRYYADGNWYATGGPDCWYCYDSAAVGAATLSQQPGIADPELHRVAVDTFDAAIAEHQLRSGAFADSLGQPDVVGTGFFTVDLGVAYRELRGTLDQRTAGAWSAAIARAADYLIDSGNTSWYINGNVNLRQTEVLWLAWSATHQQRFLDAYESEWSFTISPPRPRWDGFGLHISRQPTRADGADGAGYLAESGGGAPGFDPSYTDAQLATATDLYVLTRDSRYLRLMNLLFNQLRPRIDSSWTLDATGGTRESYREPFMNQAVSVLAASGDRPDLVSGVSGQLRRVETEYAGAETFTNVNYYKGLEGWISMPLLDRQWAQASTSATPPATSQIPVTVLTAPTATSAQRRPPSTARSRDARRPATPRVIRTRHGITVRNAPRGAIVKAVLLSVAPGRGHAGGRPEALLAHTVRVRVTRHRLGLVLRVPQRTLSRARHNHRRLIVRVTIVSGGHVRRLSAILH
jgi:hypothetical protein